MNNLTAEQILAMISQNITTPIQLETDINFSDPAEMYSISNENKKKKKKLNKNTFQQSSVNVRGQAPAFSASPAQAPEMKEVREIPGDLKVGVMEPRYGRRLNYQEDKIVEMHLQFGHIKQGNRHSRVKAYISIKTETDARYMIFMRSAMTSAVDETFRSIRNDCDKVLESEADKVYEQYHSQGLFMGRVKYKPAKGNKIEKHHRKNLPLSLLSAYIEDGYWHVKFYFLDREYDFILDEEISKKQEPYYSAQGTWYDDSSALSIEEAFGG